MSTTAARIPAFRQCILPAGWDMARPPAVPGRALARPPAARPRRPGSARSALPAPAPAPAPRTPATRLAWAPPRLGAPRGSGDWALTSWRPSASPGGPRGSRRQLPRSRHFQGWLGVRPAGGSRAVAQMRRPRPTPPRSRLQRPGRWLPGWSWQRTARATRPREAAGSLPGLPGTQRPHSRSARRRRSPLPPRPCLLSSLSSWSLLCLQRPQPRAPAGRPRAPSPDRRLTRPPARPAGILLRCCHCL
jgi:hypothetical protein